MVRDRRYAVSRLTEDVPEGPQGQPAHKAGTEVQLVEVADVAGVGGVSFAMPRPSELLLHGASNTLKRAAQLRKKSLSQVSTVKWTQPGIKYRFSNVDLLFDFFGEAMDGVIVAYAAIDARLNEFFTKPVEHNGQLVSVDQIQGYWSAQRKLDLISSSTHLEWLDAAKRELGELKYLRDAAIHIKTYEIRTKDPGTPDESQSHLWTALLNEVDFERYGRLAELILNGLKSPAESIEEPDEGSDAP